MDEDEVSKRDGKARQTNEVEEVRRVYIAADYKLELYPGREIGRTGRLDIGELRPCQPGGSSLPRFGIRWDDKGSAIDVDAFDCTGEERGQFRRGKPGYSGHKTTILDQPGRVADWKLVWDGRLLYHGQIRCSVGRDVEAAVTVRISAEESDVHRRMCHNCGEEFTVVSDETLCPKCQHLPYEN